MLNDFGKQQKSDEIRMADHISYTKSNLCDCVFSFKWHFISLFSGFIIGAFLCVDFFTWLKSENLLTNLLANPTFRVEYFVNDYYEYFLADNHDVDEKLVGKQDIILHYGDNLFYSIVKNHFDRNDANDIVSVLIGSVDMKKLMAGQLFHVDYSYNISAKPYDRYRRNYNRNEIYYPEYKVLIEERRIEKFIFKLTDGTKYIVERVDDGYILHIEKPKLALDRHIISGEIHNSLFSDVLSFDVKASTLYNVLNEYAFLIDFQRDLRQGDKFLFVIDTKRDADGDVVDEKVLYVSLTLSGKKYEIFNFEGNFFDRKGYSVKKALLKTPIDGARISSRFNLHRKHPILGYTKAHLGVDLAAPTGTPIYSAGDGVIVAKKQNDSYGNYVDVRHNNEYTTRYAHMSRFAKISVGQRVLQRQVIGYVGMTGRATGPHLHYEVIRHGVHINPSLIKVASTKSIDKNKIDRFNMIVNEIDGFIKNN